MSPTPFGNDRVIAGQGTACLEALQDGIAPDAIFAPCGGGGLTSGTYLAAQALAPHAQVYGVEPTLGNDAQQSLRKGNIVRLPTMPDTIADGVRTLAVAERTFQFLQKINGIFAIDEQDIIYWTQYLTHLLKITVEPSSALAMAGAAQWLKEQSQPQTILIILSGGNLSAETHQRIWQENLLLK